MKFLANALVVALLLAACAWSPEPNDMYQTQIPLAPPEGEMGQPQEQLRLTPPPAPQVANATGYTRTDQPVSVPYRNYLGYIPTLITIDYGLTQNSYNRYAPVVESYARMSVDTFNRDFPSLLAEKGLQIVQYFPSYPISVPDSNALPAVFYSRVYITVKEFQGTQLNLTSEQIDEIKKANAEAQKRARNAQRNANRKHDDEDEDSVVGAASDLASAQPESDESEIEQMARRLSETSDPLLAQNNIAPSGGAGRTQAPARQNTPKKQPPPPNPWEGIDLPPPTPKAMIISIRGEILLLEPGSGEVLWAAASLWRESVIDLQQGEFDKAVQSYIYHHSQGMRDELLQQLQAASPVVLASMIDEMRMMKGLPVYPDAPVW